MLAGRKGEWNYQIKHTENESNKSYKTVESWATIRTYINVDGSLCHLQTRCNLKYHDQKKKHAPYQDVFDPVALSKGSINKA